MKQIYNCPNCKAPVNNGFRFCSNCGTKLNMAVDYIPPRTSAQPSISYYTVRKQQYPQNKAINCQQSNVRPYGQLTQYNNQISSQGNQYQPHLSHDTSVDAIISQMHGDISKLLEDFFEKPNKYTKAQ